MDGPETLIGALLDREPVPANTAARSAGIAASASLVTPSLTVTVVWGDLAQVAADAHVAGHYQGVTPTAAELALDVAISGKSHQLITEHTRHGWIDAQLGEVRYFPSKGEPVKRAAIVSMGQVGAFTEPRAALMYRSLWAELMALGEVRTVATVMIGSGAGNLLPTQAARAFVRGLVAALDTGIGTELTEVLVVEQDRLRADQLLRALQKSAAADTVPGTVHVTEELREEAGGGLSRNSATVYAVRALTRLVGDGFPADAIADEPGRAAAVMTVLDGVDERIRDWVRGHLADLARTDPEELAVAINRELPDQSLPVRVSVLGGADVLSWAALTAYATLPERRVPVDWDLLGKLIERLTEPCRRDAAELPPLLSRLLVPIDFQQLIAEDTAVLMDVDRATALVPWEFLTDIRQGLGDGRKPLAVRTPISRRLRTEYAEVGPERTAEEGLRVLVIGDAGDANHRLRGAREEALETLRVLKALEGVEVTAFIGAPGFVAQEEPGIEAATRLDTLRALLGSGFDIVHYCGHGTYVPGAGRRSGWVFEDGLLGGRELMHLDRPPRLVVANACWSAQPGVVPAGSRTGRASEERLAVKPESEFVSTLADEFLRAGVRHYIGAAWRVPDRLAVDFARTFYDRLLGRTDGDGASVGEAVRAAREAVHTEREISTSDDKGFRTHCAWAAYQHYGDPTDTLIPAERPNRRPQ
ncbi:CHAT domain-containing protein [Kitasatospora cinereorecta]|uniref:CHAT domain-containing protein n=1 Tax=Kitasatospora cinereorecta TaxID=285560 RepID=A0ABW0V7U2_9ACTN